MMVWKLAYCQPILTAIVCLAAGTSGGYVPGACSNARVLECLAPLNDVEYNVGQAVVPYMDETTLRDHCNRYNKFETCMENVRPSCTLTERLVYQGIEDAYTFLCEDGFKAYLTHRKCFANPNVHQEGDSCNSTFIQRLNQIKTSPRDVDYKRERICQYVKQYLDCVENILESFCTKEAAKWQRTLDEKSMSPLLNGLDCTLDGSTNQMETLPEYAVLDGAMGTEVIKVVGSQFNRDNLWSSRILFDREDVFIPIHQAYLEHGADMIMTNTYKPTVEMFMDRLDISREHSVELFRKAARIARNVRDEFWEKIQKDGTTRFRPLVVASQVSYAGRTFTGDEYVGAFVDHTSFEEMVEGHRDKTRALVEGGVDIIGFETLPYADEGRVIVEVLKEFPQSRAWLAFSCKDDKHTCHGELFRDAAMTSLLSDQIIAVGVNCSNPEIITSLLKEIPVEVKEKKKIVVYPNSGQVWEKVDKYWYGEVAKPLHEYVPEWIDNGANWIGGCCNVVPEDISKIREAMKKHLK